MQRSRRKKKDDLIGYVLIFLSIIILSAIFYFFMQSQSKIKAIDKNTLCPEGGPVAKTVVLIDLSDPYPQIVRDQMLRFLKDIKNSTMKHEQLQVYVMTTANEISVNKKVDICNPGSGEDVSEWTSNPRMIKKKWKESFSEPINDVFRESLKSGDSDISPILESIKSISVYSLIGIDNNDIPKKLIIFSDMIQNSSAYSQYKSNETYKNFIVTRKGRKSLVDLNGSHVSIYYVRRGKYAVIQGKNHISFWRDWIMGSSGVLENVKSIR